MLGVGAPDDVNADLGQAEVADLACVDQLADGAGGLFDGYVGVEAVLVEQVDLLNAEPGERALDDLADVVGP